MFVTLCEINNKKNSLTFLVFKILENLCVKEGRSQEVVIKCHLKQYLILGVSETLRFYLIH